MTRFLGQGWSFPVALDGGGKTPYAVDEEKIRQSIFIILGTSRGERVMRPDFGSRIHELVFASVNSSTKGLLSHYVTQALTQWEPRIDVILVTVKESDRDGMTLNISVDYRIRATNSMFNLVYPFYLERER